MAAAANADKIEQWLTEDPLIGQVVDLLGLRLLAGATDWVATEHLLPPDLPFLGTKIS